MISYLLTSFNPIILTLVFMVAYLCIFDWIFPTNGDLSIPFHARPIDSSSEELSSEEEIKEYSFSKKDLTAAISLYCLRYYTEYDDIDDLFEEVMPTFENAKDYVDTLHNYYWHYHDANLIAVTDPLNIEKSQLKTFYSDLVSKYIHEDYWDDTDSLTYTIGVIIGRYYFGHDAIVAELTN